MMLKLKSDRSQRRAALLDMPRNAGPKESRKGLYGIRGLVAVLAGLNILLLYGIFASSRGILGYREQCRQVAELEARVERMREENQKAFQKLQYLKKSPELQEKLVRDQLGWTREGELVVEFIAPESEKAR